MPTKTEADQEIKNLSVFIIEDGDEGSGSYKPEVDAVARESVTDKQGGRMHDVELMAGVGGNNAGIMLGGLAVLMAVVLVTHVGAQIGPSEPSANITTSCDLSTQIEVEQGGGFTLVNKTAHMVKIVLDPAAFVYEDPIVLAPDGEPGNEVRIVVKITATPGDQEIDLTCGYGTPNPVESTPRIVIKAQTKGS